MSILCDTNIISELARPNPNPGVLAWSETITEISLSVITLEEIYYGLASKPSPRVKAWFDAFLITQCKILPVNQEIAQYAGELRGRLRTQGQLRTQAAMLIAATAVFHQIFFATRNIKDFQDCGITLINPFT